MTYQTERKRDTAKKKTNLETRRCESTLKNCRKIFDGQKRTENVWDRGNERMITTVIKY